MMNWLQRSEALIGAENIEKFQNKHVLVAGLGGIGSFAAEYIARAGIGTMTIIDGDVVEASNRNRQLPALISSEGQSKAQWMAQRLLDINANLNLHVHETYIVEEKINEILNVAQYDYVIDAIDTISPKVSLIKNCLRRKIPIVSAMGAGGKLDPEKVRVANIYDTFNCTLAQQVRKTLRKWKIKGNFKAVFSEELPDKTKVQYVEGARHKKSYLGTISYMPSLFGCFCASVVIRDLMKK
ncbi:MAG: tRNA threonylcarbamoyladenosine dehydratase [Raineya sp.]|jgi:tRNA A37 threonylcarbamoyladenosine dehydratase|nr:tRNA threonylcarbamoyladenosine dehydratase [Raineya sp.]